MIKNTQYISILFSLTIMAAIATPFSALASIQNDFEVAGWIPYWKSVEGAAVAEKNIDTLNMIFPFGYSVETDGTLNDLAKLESTTTWDDLIDTADNKDVAVIPTITWNDGINIERILSDRNLREDHIEAIDDMVTDGHYDGVDIDYEGKLAATKDDFSLFLEELKDELGSKKILVCSIEARTPPESLYQVVQATIEYANDYEAIGEHCDRVILLAYDQGRADFRLNDAKSGTPYIPIADVEWVRKVVTLAAETIPKEKIMLGVPTYGFEYEVTVSPNRFADYKKLWSVSAPYASEFASSLGMTSMRNKAGELSFSYKGESTPLVVGTSYPAPASTLPGDIFAQKALSYANTTGQTISFNTLWWSDAEAIRQKIALARELGLKGISIFRIDGTEDPALWNVLATE